MREDQTDAVHLIEDQNGVLQRSQLASADLVRDARRNLYAKRWQRPVPSIVVTHNGPLTSEQRLWVAQLAAPSRSALSGPTALELDGLRGFEADAVHLTVPCGRRAPRLDFVVPHWSRFLEDDDVHPLRRPYRTRPARSCLDAAAWARDDRGARAVILAAVQQRLTTPTLLRTALPRRGPCSRHALIEEAIRDADGGIQSIPEHEFDGIVVDCRLPPPTRQQILTRPGGRYYLDVWWEDYRVGAEVDGMPHMSVLAWDDDCDRANEITSRGRILLRFTSYAVRHRPLRVGDQLVRALVTGGWPGLATATRRSGARRAVLARAAGT